MGVATGSSRSEVRTTGTPAVATSTAIDRLSGYARRRRVEIGFYGAAVVVRMFTLAVYRPTVAQWIDGPRFARIVPWDGVFSDFWAPAGYPAFLAIVRMVWDNLSFTVAVQHGLGVLTAGLLAGVARRAGVPRPWHLLGGALVAFGGDYLFLEHLLMAETLFLLTLAAGTYLAVRTIAELDPRLAAGASLSFAAAGLVRSNALVALFLLPAFLLFVRSVRPRSRLLLVGTAAVPGVLVVVTYLTIATSVGPYAGLSDMTGWHLYSRVAPFANCGELPIVDEQPELAALCPSAPPGSRLGPYFYEWSLDSPARQLWGLDPEKNEVLQEFGIDAIRHQPLDYLHAVGADLVRAFAPSFRPVAGSGQVLSAYSFGYRDPATESVLEQNYALEYTGTEVVVRRGAGVLTAYQDATRLPGAILALSIVAAIAGAAAADTTRRRQVLFVLALGLTILLGPILLFTWDFRYVLPASALLVLGGVIGVNVLRARLAPAPVLTGTMELPGDTRAAAVDEDSVRSPERSHDE